MDIKDIYKQKKSLEERLYRIFKKFEKDNKVIITDVEFEIDEETEEYKSVIVQTSLHNEYKKIIK